MSRTETTCADATLQTTPKMRSVRFHGPGDVRVEDIDEPTCGAGQVKIRPAYTGICGTDVHEYVAGQVLIPGNLHPLTGHARPVTLGHEFGGVVEEVGQGVSRVHAGQKAVLRPTIFDKKSCSCRLRYEYYYDHIGFISISGFGGGMAKYTVAPEEHFYYIPNHLSLESAALIEPLAVAWHAVSVSPFKPGENAMVIGGGAKSIMVAELLGNRKQLALDFRATDIIDPKEVDVPSRVRGLTDSTGADAIFDTAGVEVALNSAIHACRTHGSMINIAVWERQPTVQVNQLIYHEVSYMGAALYDEKSFREVIEAMSTGQLNPEKMITDKIRLADVVERGFETLLNDRGDHCKILVDAQS